MLPLLHLLKFKGVFRRNHSFLIDCHQIHLRNLLLFCFGLSIARHYLGDNITCLSGGSSVSLQYIETLCLINGTITLEPIRFSHEYYQWISLMLLLLAFSFYLPYRLWSRHHGIYLDEITRGLTDIKACQRVFQLIERSRGHGLFWKTWALEIAYSFHLILHLFLLDRFFNRAWSTYGWRFATLDILFPVHGKCFFEYISGGADSTARIICLLPLNAAYHKIFAVLFVAFLSLAVLQAGFLPYRFFLVWREGTRRIDAWWTVRIACDACHSWEAKDYLEHRWLNVKSKKEKSRNRILPMNIYDATYISMDDLKCQSFLDSPSPTI